MGIVERTRLLLFHAGGGAPLLAERDALASERDAYLSQRDIAIGERNEFLRQRDIALGERNELQRRLQGLSGVSIPDRPGRLYLAELERMVRELDSHVAERSDAFFAAVDVARLQTFVEVMAKPDGLEDALLGIKLINLLIAKHEYQRGHIAVTARPIGVMLDPANQCHLGCPSCVNSYNTEAVSRVFNVWPRGMMTQATFDTLAQEAGVTAFAAHLYNNHEPLLNKQTPAFARQLAALRARTFISSNLSYARIDAAAIVASGLTELMVAADGVTQPVYERYRRGGKIEWVLANARAIAEEKRRTRSPTPLLRWQYLTFEHNAHEVPRAIELARAIGFDSFNVATPNVVSWDDPSLTPLVYEGPRSIELTAPLASAFYGAPPIPRDLVEAALRESALARWEATGADDTVLDGPRCDWLHLAAISDATGRIVPCCHGDYKSIGRLAFARLGGASSNFMDSPDYRMARRVVADRPAAEAELVDVPPRDQVVCMKCPGRTVPQIGLGAAYSYLTEIPELAALGWLHDWSRHTQLDAP